MNITRSTMLKAACALLALFAAATYAGPYAPAAGQVGSTAVSWDDSSIVAWATGYENYIVGSNVDSAWQTPAEALGVAGNSDGTNQGFTYDIVSLGRGGQITLTFDKPITNGEGADFLVFENSFNDSFLEIAWVEVSSDGVNFTRYPNISFTPSPVAGYGVVDPTNITGYAGKYRAGQGTPFDLNVLDGTAGLDINAITHVRLVDIIGDGSAYDDYPGAVGGPNIIYDPYPTNGSAGLDLDAVGVIHEGVNDIASSGESDFDADADDDILLRSSTTNGWRLFTLQTNAVSGNSAYAAYTNSSWVHIANLDIDADLDKDVLLRNTSTGAWRLFTTENGAVTGNAALAGIFSSLSFNFEAAIDVDADGDEDILLRNSSDGKWKLFTVENGAVTGNTGFNLWSSSNYSLVLTGDFDGDMDDDILLRDSTSGKYRLFEVDAGNVISSAGMAGIYASGDFSPQVASDFDADGDDDLIIRSISNGNWRLYQMQNNAIASAGPIYPYQNTAWTLQSEGDFDGDGDADLLLRNGSGNWKLFTVENAVVTGNTGIGIYSHTDWQIQR